jgi:DNA mismatch repair protein MutH
MQSTFLPPTSVNQLLERAEALAGYDFAELADLAQVELPHPFKHHKGWTGQIVEHLLGGVAGSKPQQDFPELGVELKTIPIDSYGMPLETTYVCYAPLVNIAGIHWKNSNVRNKLSCVLWIPVEGARDIPPEKRRVAMPILWKPSPEQDYALEQDWQELQDMICLGQVEEITAKIGQVMQLRPKAADGKALTSAIGRDGQLIQTRPRGYYLRKNFTRDIIHQYFE